MSTPNYTELVKFLMEPLVESAAELHVDSEAIPSRGRVLVRVAFGEGDRGRVFGRGGRNIQAIRTILAAVSHGLNEQVHLEVFGGEAHPHEVSPEATETPATRLAPSRRDRPRPERPKIRAPRLPDEGED